MDNPTILVADGDPKNLQILRENLETAGFEVIVAADGMQAWQKISSSVPDLILSEVNLPKLDGFQLLEKLKADPVTSSIPLMFLTNRRELQDRVRSLRGGVKDYMIKPLHIKEVLARIRMILRRMERIKEDEAETAKKLVGRLEEFSPVDLIESFGVERKTGVLTLHNENNRNGEIYFRDGAVVNASLGNLKAEKAVYQMLPWKHGHFTMIFKEINVPDEISVSNLGLLLQGFKRMEERERLFKLLPSPETTFVITDTFRSVLQKRELTTEVSRFVSLIDGRRDLLQIIDESTYDDIKTLERLVKLYQQGFIKPSKTIITAEDDERDLSSTLAEPKILEKISAEIAPAPPVPVNFKVTAVRSEKAATPAPTVRERVEKTSETVPLRQPVAEEQPPILPTPPKSEPPPEAEPPQALEESQEISVVDSSETQSFKFPETATMRPLEDVDLTDDSELATLPSFWHEHADEIWGTPQGGNGADGPTIELREEMPEEEGATDRGDDFAPSSEPLPTEPIAEDANETGPALLPIDLQDIMSRPVQMPSFLQDESPHTSHDEISASPEEVAPPEFEPSPVSLENIAAFFENPEEPVESIPTADRIEPLEQPAAINGQIESSKREAVKPAVPPDIPPAAAITPAPVIPDEQDRDDQIALALQRLLQQRQPARPKLVVIGRDSFHLSAFVKSLAGPESSVRKIDSATFRHLEMGERKLPSQQAFEIIGISMEQQFTRLLANVAHDLVSFILVIEAHQQEDLGYCGYLLKMLKAGYKIPFGIAVIKAQEKKNLSPDTLRDLVNAEPADYLHECNPSDAASVETFLAGLVSDANLTRW